MMDLLNCRLLSFAVELDSLSRRISPNKTKTHVVMITHFYHHIITAGPEIMGQTISILGETSRVCLSASMNSISFKNGKVKPCTNV